MNFYLLDFAIASLLLEKRKNLFVFSMLFLVVFLAGSFLFTASSMRQMTLHAADALPEIVVQKRVGGRLYPISMETILPIVEIEGVASVTPRVWGTYTFDAQGTLFSVVGVDRYDYLYGDSLASVRKSDKIIQGNGVAVGEGVYRVLKSRFFTKEVHLLSPKGEMLIMPIVTVFPKSTALFTNDLLVMDVQKARKVLGISKDEASDLLVDVPNPDEVDTIAQKISLLSPVLHVRTKEQIRTAYEEMFDYKSGVFLLLFTIVLATLFFLTSERLSGLSHAQRKEIAVLKAIGWSIRNIISVKFYEGFFIASFAYFGGVAAAFFYVYVLQAPLLRFVFSGFSTLRPPLELTFFPDWSLLLLLFLITVPVYFAALIIPAWRAAVEDVDEVLR